MNEAVFKPVCNRTDAESGAKFALPADGFIQIVPLGRAVSMEGVRQIVDDAALDALLNSARGAGEMMMDREHESHNPEKRTDALAWLDRASFVKRPDGLYARPRLTNTGEVDVLGGTLRFVSPEFERESLQDAGEGSMRPMRLTGASFTNRPAFRRGKPVTNRDPQTEPTKDTMKKDLCLLLKLDESAADSVVLNRVREIFEKAGKHDDLAGELQTVRNREADDLIKTHDAVLPKDDTLRKTLREMILTNRAGADAMIAGFKSSADEAAKHDPARQRADRKPVFNRESASQPTDDEKAQKAAAARGATIKNRALALQSDAKRDGRSLSWQQAWAAAEAEQQ